MNTPSTTTAKTLAALVLCFASVSSIDAAVWLDASASDSSAEQEMVAYRSEQISRELQAVSSHILTSKIESSAMLSASGMMPAPQHDWTQEGEAYSRLSLDFKVSSAEAELENTGSELPGGSVEEFERLKALVEDEAAAGQGRHPLLWLFIGAAAVAVARFRLLSRCNGLLHAMISRFYPAASEPQPRSRRRRSSSGSRSRRSSRSQNHPSRSSLNGERRYRRRRSSSSSHSTSRFYQQDEAAPFSNRRTSRRHHDSVVADVVFTNGGGTTMSSHQEPAGYLPVYSQN